MNIVSIIDVFFKDSQEVSVEERFMVETLFIVLRNMNSKGIDEYNKTIYALIKIRSYS